MPARITLIAALAAALALADEKTDFFERDVRPLLAARCHSCHGPKAAFAGLRLDTAAGALSVRDKLIQALRGEAGRVRMPPTGPLPAQEIAMLERWIGMGAPWPAGSAAPAGVDLAARLEEHWAWQPIRAVPWPARQLAATTGPADLATLLRRITFDLTGLPATPAEIQDFAKHRSFERVVDRLLNSPQYGERMARRWMDIIRYSESHGSEGDPDTPDAWRYRDYLIRAFNQDVPYSQLIREHVAGDLLPDPRVNAKEHINESRLALAHWRMVEHGFQPVDPWEDRIKWTDNQVDVFSKAFQGLTISCARCHDHKFDAISQKDYYALFGIIAAARPTQSAIDSPEVLNLHRDKLAALKPQIRAELARRWRSEVPGQISRIPLAVRTAASLDWLNPLFPLSGTDAELQAWLNRSGKELTSRHEFNKKHIERRWTLATEYSQWPRQGVGAPDQPSLPGEFAVLPDGPTAIGGIYPGGVYSHLLSSKHGAVAMSPRFKIDSDSISLRFLGGNFSFAQLIIENYAVPRGGIFNSRTSAKRDEMGWVRWDTSFWKGFTAYIEFATLNETTHITGDPEDGRLNRRPPSRHTGRSWWGGQEIAFQNNQTPLKEEMRPVNYAIAGAPSTVDAYERHLERQLTAAIDAFAAARMTDAQAAFLDSFVRQGLLSNAPSPLIAEYRRLENEIAIPRRAPGIVEEAGPDHPLLVRGDPKRLGEPVPRRYVTALNGQPYTDPKTMRMALANDLTRKENPLTTRVIANRLFQFLFREGIVATPDNFGKLGAAPKDLDLLDGLATQFAADGWSIKKMLRRLLLSPAYQSRDLPARRLEAEEIRDAILSATGQLDLTMYGESVPVYYAHETGSTKGDRPKGPLDGKNRRSVYLEIRRNATNPFLEIFDVYKPASTRGLRDVTNVPAQSLALMNSPFVMQLTEKYAAALGAAPDRVDQLYLRALGRAPTARERDEAETFAAEAKTFGPVVQAVFNLKEFLYVR